MYFSTISGALICGLMLILCITVSSDGGFDPRNDAEILKKAIIDSKVINEDTINVLAHRPLKQRLEIASYFHQVYKQDLVDCLKKVTSGDFQELLVAMMTPLDHYYVKEIEFAIYRIFINTEIVIEIMCTSSNQEIKEIKKAFQLKFGRTLEQFFSQRLFSDFWRLMIALSEADRDETTDVDVDAAWEDAYKLYQAGESLLFGTRESFFISTFAKKNLAQLDKIFSLYETVANNNHSIETAIKYEFSGNMEAALLTIVKNVTNRAGFFAEKIYQTMDGPSTSEDDLTRFIVTQSEKDMDKIKQAFITLYNQSLENFISDNSSGGYKDCLLSLIDSEKNVTLSTEP